MESSQHPAGQKLQWWQENTPTPRSKWYQETVTHEEKPLIAQPQPAAPVELWDELEAEAVRRVEEENLRRSQEWVVKGNSDKVIKHRTRRLVTLLAMLTVFYAGLAAVSQSLVPVYAILAVAVFAFFARQRMVRKIKSRRNLEMGISRFGISFDGPNFNGLLKWHEIRQIDRRKISGQRFIVFHATDPAVIDRLNFTAEGTVRRDAVRKWGWIARAQRLDLHAVYLPEDVLPMDADTFLARVATAQSAAKMHAH